MNYIERTILLRDKILLNIDLKIILSDHQNNFVELQKMSNYKKFYSSLMFYIIILIIRQNYFSDLYPAKILDLLAKPFFPC